MATKREYEFSGIDCAVCAKKIETGIKKLDGIIDASMDFTLSRLLIETDDSVEKSHMEQSIQQVMDSVEKGSKLLVAKDETEHEEKRLPRSLLILYAVSAAAYFLGLIFVRDPIAEIILFGAIFLAFGHSVLAKSFRNILKGKVFDENFLMTIATIGAFIIGEYPEGAAVMMFYQIGEIFQDYAVDHSRRAIKSLLNIKPDYANLKTSDGYQKVSPSEIKTGDSIIVRPGERVPLDGIVIEGASFVDTSALTGESMPREVYPGSEILSGSINQSGVLTVKVTKLFGDSTVNRILSLVENAAHKKSKTERFITRFASWYTPVVVGLAALIALIPPLFSGGNFSDWVYRALVFLVLSCPCALVISIPLGFFGGIGAASKHGIMVKGGNYLEALAKMDTVVFDKTGTLTKGVFEVTEAVPAPGIEKDDLLYYMTHAEAYSTHPLAQSIVRSAIKEPDKSLVSEFQEHAGMGVTARVENRQVVSGNTKLLRKFGMEPAAVDGAGTLIHLAVDGQYYGYARLEDTLKSDSEKTVKALHEAGVKNIIMLTGDQKNAAGEIAKKLGIDSYQAELLPHEKVERLEEIIKNRSGKGNVAFVGDGINDSPVIARADIGIAMGGTGSDAAIEAADIVMMTDEPSKLVDAIKIAKKTGSIVFQNIMLAIGVKLIVLTLGAGGLATLWEAVFADVGVALLAILNATRLTKARL